jgi:hypothetical protein
MGVIIPMPYNTAEIFRKNLETLMPIYGNTYSVFDRDKNLLPYEFEGIIETRLYKDYSRRLLKTLADVSYLQPNYFLAIKTQPDLLLRIWDYDFKYIQNKPVYTMIYLTSISDPIERIAKKVAALEGN